MCGRFTLRTPLTVLIDEFHLGVVPEWTPRYNIAPSNRVLVLRSRRELSLLGWGFVPHWARQPRAMINARAESAAEKSMFRDSFKKRRCVLLADGFFEWKKLGGAKQPYYFRLSDDRPFGFAGLWDRWQDLETCTILTTEANALVAACHDRMPVMLTPADCDRWLDPNVADAAELQYLLQPFPAEEMVAYPVDTKVNKVAADDPTCIEPLPDQRSLF